MKNLHKRYLILLQLFFPFKEYTDTPCDFQIVRKLQWLNKKLRLRIFLLFSIVHVQSLANPAECSRNTQHACVHLSRYRPFIKRKRKVVFKKKVSCKRNIKCFSDFLNFKIILMFWEHFLHTTYTECICFTAFRNNWYVFKLACA